MAITRAGSAIRMTANGDTIAHAVSCNKIVVYAATDITVRLRKGVVGGAIAFEAFVPAASATQAYDIDFSMPAAGVYLEIASGTGSVTLYSE